MLFRSFSGQAGYWLGTFTAMLTAFYSFRLISLVFLSYPNAPKNDYLHSHEASPAVVIPLFVLSLFSIFFGYIFADLFVGLGTDFFGNSLFIHPGHITMVEAEFSLPLFFKLLPSILSVLAAGLALVLYHKSPSFLVDLTNSNLGRSLYQFFNGKYLIDIIYNNYIIGAFLQLGYSITKVLDRGVIELVGPHGLSSVLTEKGEEVAKLDTGVVTSYALYIVLGLISILFLVFAPVLLNSDLVSTAGISSISGEIRLIIIYIASLVLVTNSSVSHSTLK